jgi:hypothetical protein
MVLPLQRGVEPPASLLARPVSVLPWADVVRARAECWTSR